MGRLQAGTLICRGLAPWQGSGKESGDTFFQDPYLFFCVVFFLLLFLNNHLGSIIDKTLVLELGHNLFEESLLVIEFRLQLKELFLGIRMIFKGNEIFHACDPE